MAEIQTEALEREMKFGAPLGIGLPDLRDLVSQRSACPASSYRRPISIRRMAASGIRASRCATG